MEEGNIEPEKNEFSFNISKIDMNSADNPPSPRNGEFSPVPNRQASIVPCISDDNLELYSSNEELGRVAGTTKRRVPIYLRASTGSCHDLCKYGGHHLFKENTREYLQKRKFRKSLPNEANSMKKEEKFEGKVADEPSRTRTLKFSPNDKSAELGPSSEMKQHLSLVKVSITKSCPPRLSALSGNKTRVVKVSSLTKSCPSRLSALFGNKTHVVKVSSLTKSCPPRLSALSGNKTHVVKVSSLAKSCSPRLSAPSRNKTRVANLLPGKKSSMSEIPEITLQPGKFNVRAREGGPGENKESVKRSSAKANLIKAKPSSASGSSHGIQTLKSLTVSTGKPLETPATQLLSSKSPLEKASSEARETGRFKSALLPSSSSTLKYRKGTVESSSRLPVKALRVVENEAGNKVWDLKARRVRSAKLASSSLHHQTGTEKSGRKESEKILHVNKNAEDNKALPSSSPIASSHSSSHSVSCQEKEDDEIHNSGYKGYDFVSENKVCIETGNIQLVQDELAHPTSASSYIETGNTQLVKDELGHPTSPSSLSNEVNEKINYSNSEADSESEYLQPLKENPDDTLLSINEEDGDGDGDGDGNGNGDGDGDGDGDGHDNYEIRSHYSNTSNLLSRKNSEEINGEQNNFILSEKVGTVVTENIQSSKESRKNLKKSKLVPSDDKNQPPVKLKFRRGKIISPQLENNIPKRLRFKRASTIDKKGNFIPDSKRPMEIGNVHPNKILRKAVSSVSYSKRSVDVKPGSSVRKSQSAMCEDKLRPPVILIRREKIVDSQMANKSPTRLKFTSRVVAGPPADGKSDVRRKPIKNTGGKNETTDFDLPSTKVTLKHPEVQRKKDGQVLLNNVIEETASKLVESRKSKVKALVGAFETVISLHELRPSH